MHWLLLFYLIVNVTSQLYAQVYEWENIGLEGSYIYDIAIDDSGNIYASANGVYKSTDNGTTWQLRMNVGALKIEIDINGNIYMAALGGVFKSTDGGNTYFQIAQSIPAIEFYDIAIIPNGTLYVSSFVGVYKSLDEGISWIPTSFIGFGAFDIGINSNGIMFFANSTLSWSGIYRSSDLGSNWEYLYPGFSATSLEYLNDGSVLAGCVETPVTSNGIYITTDNGDTWENTNFFTGTNLTFPDFELDLNNDIYVSVQSSNPSQRGVYISSNYGYYWSYIGLSSTIPINCLAIDSSGYIYAGSVYEGIFRAPGRTVPVELISFIGNLVDGNILLNWSTATETNNRGFEIERKTVNYQWEKIGFVPGHGTTAEKQYYSFIDESISPGNYQYRLKQIDYSGTFEYSDIVEVIVGIPTKFSLGQNYPNPFNPTTTIAFTISDVRFTILKVYDVLGNEVATLVNEELPASEYEIEWNASDLPSGIYFYQLQVSSFVETKKMIYLR
jgi:photosystem II stability/assembly factor-like uncharacterized protein